MNLAGRVGHKPASLFGSQLRKMEGTMPKNRFHWPLFATMILSTLVLQGCAQRSPQKSTDKAEALVETILDSWTRGVSPDKFGGSNQSIVVTDPDWSAGYRLLSFLSIEAKPTEGTPPHVRCRVALSLADPTGKKVDKEVVYDVQVGDKSVIRRESQ
jgi:hypothetical protein